MAYDKIETFHRPVQMSIVDYLSEFECLHNKIKHYDMEMPIEFLNDFKTC